jgi:hypothetical protein
MEGLAFENQLITQRSSGTKGEDSERDKVGMNGDGDKLHSERFKSEKYELSEKQKQDFEKAIVRAIARLKKEKFKILFVGHASCRADMNATIIEERYEKKLAEAKTESEKEILHLACKKDIYAALFQYNYKLSLNRAFEVYKLFLSNSDIKAALCNDTKCEGMRYIGMSERLAASGDDNLICSDEEREKGKRTAQAVDVFTVEEWPTIFKIKELQKNNSI